MSRRETHGRSGPRRIEISTPEDGQGAADETAGEAPQECPFVPEARSAEQTQPAEAPAEAGEEGTSDEELAKLQAMLEELENRCAYAEDQHLRLAAELQNYRRQVQREKEELTRYAVEGIVTELIPVLDNFERAMEVKVDSAGAECLMAGVKMVHGQILAALEGHGVKRIEALGETFDPHLHEAVEREESTALPPGVVVAELAKGYLLQERVVRPARVRVTVRPEGKSTQNGGDAEEVR